MLENLPYEMRLPSIISIIMFSFGGIIITYLHTRLARVEKIVMDTCVDVERIEELIINSEKNNREMMEWIRTDNQATWNRVEKSLAEIRKQLYNRNKPT